MQPGNPVVGGTVLRRVAIQSPNYVPGVSGWAIREDGTAEFTSLIVDGGTAVQITITFTDGSQIHLYGGAYTEDNGTVINGTWEAFTPAPQPGATWAPGVIGAQSDPAGPTAFLLLAAPYNSQVAGTQSRIKLQNSGVVDIDASIIQSTAGAGNGGGPFFVLASDSGRTVLSSRVVGEIQNRLLIAADGSYSAGPGGSTTPDVHIFRDGNNAWGLQNQLRIYGLAGADGLRLGISGEARLRYMVDTTGGTNIGDGTNPPDVAYYRAAAAKLGVTGDLALDTAGRGLQIKEGANAKMGTAVLAGGTVVVATTAVTANSRIFLTAQTTGAAPGALRVSARTAGTSFTITSTSATDTSTVAWMLVEPS